VGAIVTMDELKQGAVGDELVDQHWNRYFKAAAQ
jgi:hypothetical protein